MESKLAQLEHRNLSQLDDHQLISQLKTLIQTERKITSEIIESIREVDRRKLYLQFGCTSLFAYLTEELGYTPASAQRRIDAARISVELPQIIEDLKSGALNLTQVSMVVQGLRQKKKELKATAEPKNIETVCSSEMKQNLIDQVKGQSLKESQATIAQNLDLKVQELEKRRVQKDESVRVETTFSKQEMADLERVKELFSHTHPNLSFKELVNLLAQEVLKIKDPLRKVIRNKRIKENFSSQEINLSITPNQANTQRTVTSAAEAEMCQSPVKPNKTPTRYIGNAVRRLIHQRDQSSCQWRDIKTGKICGSRFQLQVDHKQSVWKGGGNEPENLQLLCSVHNRLKYDLEPKKLSDNVRDYRYERTG